MPIRPDLATGVRRLLGWYAARPALRALVRYLPFGTGNALDVALLVVQDSLLVKGRGTD